MGGNGKNHYSSKRQTKHSKSCLDNRLVANHGKGKNGRSESLLDLRNHEGGSNSNFIQLASIAVSQTNNNHRRADPKEIIDAPKTPRSSLASSSSISTSSDDLIELMAKNESKSGLSNVNCRPLLNVSSKSGEILSPDNNTPTSQVSTVTNESARPSMTSPAIHVMDRGGYDPQRIPSLIFERKKSTAADGMLNWSAASNDSLFSLHIGNNSFSKDQASHWNELHKSKELFKSEELIAYSPSVSMGKSSDFEEKKCGETEETAVRIEREEKLSNPGVSWSSPTTSSDSDQSAKSVQSFSIPIRITEKTKEKEKEKEKKKKCYGWAWSCCSLMFCCNDSGDSITSSSRPHCCCCKCCYCCCSHKQSSSTLTEKVTSDEVKRNYDKERYLQKISQANPKKSKSKKLFCCFPSCSWWCSSCSCSLWSCS